MHSPDTRHLYHLYCSSKASMWIASVIVVIINRENLTYEKVVYLTSFSSSATARNWAPASPIWLHARSNVISVWNACLFTISEKWEAGISHLVNLQCAREILDTCIIDCVPEDNQYCQCLHVMCAFVEHVIHENRVSRTLFTFNEAARYWTPVVLIWLWERSSVVSVCDVWYCGTFEALATNISHLIHLQTIRQISDVCIIDMVVCEI
jgi:hypothetical protein